MGEAETGQKGSFPNYDQGPLASLEATTVLHLGVYRPWGQQGQSHLLVLSWERW